MPTSGLRPALMNQTAPPARLALWIAAWLLGCLLLAYGFDVGHGFLSDDFGWIAHSRQLRSLGDLERLFVETPMGFYRPLVSLSFFANHLFAGSQPIGYAAVNLALVGGTAAAVVWLTRAQGFGAVAGVFGAGLWMFNLHGIGMSVMWISGRTSLLATLFAVLAGVASTRRRSFVAAACTLAALLSKEEPIMLPAILAGWVAIDAWGQRSGWRSALGEGWRVAWPSFVALAVYLALRDRSPAMTPSTAPTYYALSLSPRVLVPNILEYADRAATIATAVVLIGAVVFARRAPLLEVREWRLLGKGALWLVLGFALTVMVPARSDLYACFPSIGVSLMAVAVGTAVWRDIPAARRRTATVAALLLPLALLPVYRARNMPNKRTAILAEQALRHIGNALAARDDITRVELFQSEDERPSVSGAFGGALPVAIEWRTGRHVTSEIHAIAPETPTPAPPPGTLYVRIDRGAIASVAGPR